MSEKEVKHRILAKSFQMHLAVDMVGSKSSMAASKNIDLEVTPLGIKMFSKASKRIVLIPWPNIKGVELYNDAAT